MEPLRSLVPRSSVQSALTLAIQVQWVVLDRLIGCTELIFAVMHNLTLIGWTNMPLSPKKLPT